MSKKQPTPPPPPNQSDLIDQAEYRGMIGNLFSILTHLFIKGDKGLLGMDHSTVMQNVTKPLCESEVIGDLEMKLATTQTNATQKNATSKVFFIQQRHSTFETKIR